MTDSPLQYSWKWGLSWADPQKQDGSQNKSHTLTHLNGASATALVNILAKSPSSFQLSRSLSWTPMWSCRSTSACRWERAQEWVRRLLSPLTRTSLKSNPYPFCFRGCFGKGCEPKKPLKIATLDQETNKHIQDCGATGAFIGLSIRRGKMFLGHCPSPTLQPAVEQEGCLKSALPPWEWLV